jgi:hypothetical protein
MAALIVDSMSTKYPRPDASSHLDIMEDIAAADGDEHPPRSSRSSTTLPTQCTATFQWRAEILSNIAVQDTQMKVPPKISVTDQPYAVVISLT